MSKYFYDKKRQSFLVRKKFGAREIWASRSLVPEKFEPRMKIITWLFYVGPKLLGDQISWEPKVRGPNDTGDHFSYSLKESSYFLDNISHNGPLCTVHDQ